jgi:hypothetical protein
MPKLDKISVDEYWQAKGPNMATMIAHIQTGENWTHDDAAFMESAVRFGQQLDKTPDGFLSTLATSKEAVDKVRFMLAAMPATMRLRLLSWLAEERTDGAVLAANILSPNGDDENAINCGKVVRDSLRHLARLDLICKIFSTNRLKTVREAIERS